MTAGLDLTKPAKKEEGRTRDLKTESEEGFGGKGGSIGEEEDELEGEALTEAIKRAKEALLAEDDEAVVGPGTVVWQVRNGHTGTLTYTEPGLIADINALDC